jgi:pyridoxal phosphate enzyme (YggS family)
VGDIAGNLAAVRACIRDAARKAGRGERDVLLVAVSKKQPKERLEEAYRAGQRVFGENYVQELERRRGEMPGDIDWHMIGHLQTNKAKKVLFARMVHTLDSLRLAETLSRAIEQDQSRSGPLDVLIEVNMGGEEQKAGVRAEDVAPLLDGVRALGGINPCGLMCIPPPGEGRRHFAALRDLVESLRTKTGLLLPHLSMGMSEDYEDAVLEGSTIVRVGTAIFGARTQ